MPSICRADGGSGGRQPENIKAAGSLPLPPNAAAARCQSCTPRPFQAA
ncbi:hypothetical protein [Kingella pumchi]|uniref:Uncharacterized protein n=1 Tax=Kingella pumchi TaxID=2779506 RepID=A0ABS9NPM8_9NEIS|nr:hypothetical protein [Kingella pumchi]MCG6504749.1 hypothetical protein [Kingella pumchi]